MKKYILTVAIALSLANVNTQEPNNTKPNIIIILADDLGYGDSGGYFGGQVKTLLPHVCNEG